MVRKCWLGRNTVMVILLQWRTKVKFVNEVVREYYSQKGYLYHHHHRCKIHHIYLLLKATLPITITRFVVVAEILSSMTSGCLREGFTKQKNLIGIFQFWWVGGSPEGSFSNHKKKQKTLKWSTCSETWNKQIQYFCQKCPPPKKK